MPGSNDKPLARFKLRKAIRIIGSLFYGLLLILGAILLAQILTGGTSNPFRKQGYITKKFEAAESVFNKFYGHQECGASLSEIYTPPEPGSDQAKLHTAFCPTRKVLLEALSNGGRNGLDAPYNPRGCHYRWFTTEEICMILSRFESIILIGDNALQSTYGGLNILLRKDLATGALRHWEISSEQRENCKCDRQFSAGECQPFLIAESKQMVARDQAQVSSSHPYACSKPNLISTLKHLLPSSRAESHRPIPIVTSFSSLSLSPSVSTQSLNTLAHTLHNLLPKRKTPILTLGPPAAGSSISAKAVAQSGNDKRIFYSKELSTISANGGDFEWLGTWNLTIQAESLDGERYGVRVAVVEAMMVSVSNRLSHSTPESD
ncbi:MAG: hypothetical protein Q9227_001033 [Pyrenula ochraceoflavens]